MKKECYQVAKLLSSNADILITKPDKGSGVVIVNKSDNIIKVKSIFHDQTKFKILGPASSNDSTSMLETRLQRRLLKLYNDELLPPTVYEAIRPIGYERFWMYGLQKTHKKDDVHLCPVLSMVGSSQHSLAKWFFSVLEPVLWLYSFHCVSDSFIFVVKPRGQTMQLCCS